MRTVLYVMFVLCAVSWLPAAETPRTPNIVILFADDLGYGDLGCYGHPTIRTPHLDRMAAEGMRFTQFYVGECVCTPSRAALLTGRLPIRSGLCSDTRRVLFPDSAGGLPDDEITLGEALKARGYATACVGKWHLGHLPQYLPTRHGFDVFFGLPYSNDMDYQRDSATYHVPLLGGEQIVERPAEQATLTRRYTEEVVSFIEQSRQKPFFVYLPYTMPHVPLFASEAFAGSSPRGLYGDVVEEIDWSVGQILEALRRLGLAENTFVFFTSDNGPWLVKKLDGGSAGLLREGKGTTWEGGMREPAVAWWPGTVPAGAVTHELAATMDLFVTAIRLAGGDVPTDRPIDGVDLRPLLRGEGRSPRDHVFYYRGTRLMAVRKGAFKAHFITQESYTPGSNKVQQHDPPLLYNLEHDPAERFDVAAENPEVVEAIKQLADEHRRALVPGKPQLEARLSAE